MITQIKDNPDYAKAFLIECFCYFRSLLTEEELLSRRKFITKCGPNKHDFPIFLVDWFHLNKKDSVYKDLIVDRWVHQGKIFKYKKQIKSIIRKYEYLIASKGV